MLDAPAALIFLPGASGDTSLWRAVADGLSQPGPRRFVEWLPDTDPAQLAREAIDGPVVVFAQSMGGVVAVRATLEKPELVRGMVLAVTSGGIDMGALGAAEWRADFAREYPGLAQWFVDEREDLSPRLPEIDVPVLLLWGDADPISPVAVGRRLAELLPRAKLVVIAGGTHDLARERAAEVLQYIERWWEECS